MSGKEVLHQLSQNPKVAAVVASATTGTGAGTILDYIPDDIGKLAVIVGIMVSLMILRVQRVVLKKENIELSMLRTKEREVMAAAIKREEAGDPLRRDSD